MPTRAKNTHPHKTRTRAHSSTTHKSPRCEQRHPQVRADTRCTHCARAHPQMTASTEHAHICRRTHPRRTPLRCVHCARARPQGGENHVYRARAHPQLNVSAVRVHAPQVHPPRTRTSLGRRSEARTPAAPRSDPEHTMLRDGTRRESPHGVWAHVCETSRTGSSRHRKGAGGGGAGRGGPRVSPGPNRLTPPLQGGGWGGGGEWGWGHKD